jgi:mannose-6-phosphate isomerase-like protein (cupin superfamily)
MSEFKILKLREAVDARGRLAVIQDELPFAVKRAFWIVDANEQLRGGHRHHRTRQALIVLSGSVDVYMNDGIHEMTVKLSSVSDCLIVEPDDWHTMYFHPGSVLLVLASEKYDPKDYIDTPY